MTVMPKWSPRHSPKMWFINTWTVLSRLSMCCIIWLDVWYMHPHLISPFINNPFYSHRRFLWLAVKLGLPLGVSTLWCPHIHQFSLQKKHQCICDSHTPAHVRARARTHTVNKHIWDNQNTNCVHVTPTHMARHTHLFVHDTHAHAVFKRFYT